MRAWKVEQFRFTVFPNLSLQMGPELGNWWNNLFDSEPDTIVNRPKNAEFKTVGLIKEYNAVVSIVAQPNRIDLHMSPIVSPDFNMEHLPCIGNLEDEVKQFRDLISKWITGDCPPAGRIAVGMVFHEAVAERRDGYVCLDEALHDVKIDIDGSSDFSYSINRPRMSQTGVDGLMINRLSKWQAVRAKQVAINYPSHEMHGQRINFSGKEQYACRVELDMNTDADYQGQLQKEDILQIFNELTDLGLEIAESGDIK